jgi:3-oxoacyl-[acyl-carrier protein] reductase
LDLLLDNRIALVAAASQGLGYAAALQLSREGALVAICSRDEARIAAAADAIQAETSRPVLGVPADVARPEDVEHLMERVVGEYGGLDILITNAGGPPASPFEEVTVEMWQSAFEITMLSAVRLIQAALPHLRLSTVPSVLTITSYSVKQPIPNLVLSNSVRMAVIGLTKTLSRELGAEGIRFNSILPGWTETERTHELMQDRASRNDTTVEEEIARQAASIALGRFATPQEFANVATFMCSPAASYLTGQMLLVDGGLVAGTM